ncbi:ArsA-related P-loop ATPase [Anaeromyxobacter sp. PSR-1]|uniref:ArsA family ATPase n=1 Tax=unclassified Anaeromyxobacter TaxID=2620896 RepID=UPI0005DB7AD3|nr:ArsA-related P-loop ATPase [Anaeromyxobacter sp. PSR-1]GAO02903.1 putative ATPase [Anaeromyxobacter sp. PSR-1]
MASLGLLDRRLLVVTGKGGVGKTTVCAALALLAARAGKRVLVCEVNATRERVAPLLGAPASGPFVREALPGIFTVNVTPHEAMREYGLMVLKFRTIYEAVFENRLVRYFLRMVPGLAELVMLGKVLHEVRAEDGGRPRWDLVLLDAPATGHAVQLLRVPSALVDTVPAGPLRHDAEWMQALLVDPARTGVALVTLPEEMPVNEVIELDGLVRGELGMAVAALVVNAMPPARFDAREAAELARLAAAPPPLGPAAEAGRIQALRAEAAGRYLVRARAALDLPTTVLPLLPVVEWGPAAVGEIAAALAAAPPAEARP